MKTFASVEELQDAVGSAAMTSDWVQIDQARIDAFADATDDHQWIHVDPDRAASGPFGATIAHGYLSLSLLPALSYGMFTLEGAELAINYGSDRVRYPSAVPVGSRLRAHAEIIDVTPAPQGVRVTQRVTMEIEGASKPAMIADTISLYVLPAAG